MRAIALGLAAALLAAPAAAAVVDAQPNGFEVREEALIKAPPAAVYAAFGRVGDWWSSQHTYSHDAHNLRLELKVGGCWCETLPNGGATGHLVVEMVQPNEFVRLAGALGPLGSTGGTGHLAVTLAPKDGGTLMVWLYDFGGYSKDGMARWAAPVDGVLGLQLTRLKAYVETGKPD
jgi:uncharacterized protein YndB with AHSA1/START domain